MLQIHVLILQHGRKEPRRDWWELYDPHRRVDNDYPLLIDKWAESCGLWPQSLINGDPEPITVALCLDKESIAAGYELPFIRRVIEQAHKSMWGAKVFVIIDDSAPLLSAVSETASESEIPEWFKTLVEHKVADILRWPIKENTDFDKAVTRSESRMETVVDCGQDRHWKCLVQSPPELSREQQSLLKPFLIDSFNELKDQNCLILISEERQEDYLKRLKRKLKSITAGGEIMIGFVDRMTDPPPDLETFCDSKRFRLVRFHGIVEVYSLLRRLNPVKLDELESYSVPVRTQRPSFKSGMPPLLLLTHSYKSGANHECLAAAYDSWELTKDLSDGMVKIYPAISCVKLAGILEVMDHLLAWIHIGHGIEGEGLFEAEREVYQPADTWVGCFAAYQSSLALAVFSACESATVAKRFAESGARVAIGFTNKVHKDICIELTKRVVKAALETNGARDAILKAFIVGRNVLNSDDEKAMPVAYWAC
jgi:hypothetical protein